MVQAGHHRPAGRRHRAAVGLLLTLLTLATGCGSAARTAAPAGTTEPSPGTTARPAPDLGPCQPVPAPGPALAWVPADLPLPSGTYPVKEIDPEPGGVRRALLVVPGTPDQFLDLVRTSWPGAGWRLGRAESEGNDAEGSFTRAPAFGGFRVQSLYCDKGRSQLTLGYATGGG